MQHHVPEPWQRRFYKSAAWQACRRAVIDRQHGLCADCLERGDCTPIADVHHIIELTEQNVGDPSVSLNPDNCVGLCKECHNMRHERGFAHRQASSRVWFDEDGVPHAREA